LTTNFERVLGPDDLDGQAKPMYTRQACSATTVAEFRLHLHVGKVKALSVYCTQISSAYGNARAITAIISTC
jgi:hypothetical protein